jgi:hypothetical protein
MMRRTIAAAMVVGGLIFASTASAATEFGTNCLANRAEEGAPLTLIQLTQNGVPTAAPSSGVITQWKIRLIPAPVTISQQLKVFRPTANPAQFQVVGESAFASVAGGENSFPTRIPVQAGDRLGIFGNLTYGPLFCEGPETESPGNTLGGFAGNPTTGTTATLAGVGTEVLVPARAVIEPDADGDGFGDETQDLCPQSPAVQAACPVVVLDAFSIGGGNAVKVLVATSTTAPVNVSGTVALGKGGKAKLSAKGKTVTAGKITHFTLKFPASLKERLSELEPRKKLTLRITASATDVTGQVTKDKLRAKLKGQG